ncbi:uracil-DNA glycosylase family protein [Thaumasiovibrio subtropicus]|uniref:uracil-DNA glycosylase family protein n=1 Tax=Thaumasiovibrio subtropicus TaxID=1891207 RepID=UPI001FEBF1AE|nr:uracil-DNA glycosylase family protein [Thaumasiovibrio subtropicus]
MTKAINPRVSPCDLFQQACQQARLCRLCAEDISPRPVVVGSQDAPILIIGQAPGKRVHETGIPWNDPSGERLRDWLNVDKETFYDESKFAIVPMGLCYPGKGKSGDLPPRKVCAPHWHPQLLPLLKQHRLTLLIGQYAQHYYLEDKPKTLTDTVKQWQRYAPETFALPHPSPRNRLWLTKNPWFEQDVIPPLRLAVQAALESKKVFTGKKA